MDGQYCPFCQRVIYPATDDLGEVIVAHDGGVIYVHDAVPHDDDFDFRELH